MALAWGGEVPDVAGGEEGVRAEEVADAAPVRPQRQGGVEVEAGGPVGGAAHGVAVRGGTHAAHLETPAVAEGHSHMTSRPREGGRGRGASV